METTEKNKLPDTFSKWGSKWTIVTRVEGVAMYLQEQDSGAKNYNVFRVRLLPREEIFGKVLPERESTPTESKWGTHGWTYSGTEKGYRLALKKLSEVVANGN